MISVQTSHQGSTAKPILLVQGEYMRRMKDMAAMQQGMNFYGELPDSYILNLNIDHPLVKGIATAFDQADKSEYQALTADKKGQEARISVIQQQLSDDKLSDEEKKTYRDDLSETRAKVDEIEEKLTKIYQDFGDNHQVISQLIDLGLLSSGLLKGASLDAFITRSMELLTDKK